MSTRPNRSNAYQQIYCEISCSAEILEAIPDFCGIAKRLSPFAYDERILDLQDELKNEVWRVIHNNLTKRQIEVITLIVSGLTQAETASRLSVNQSSITKSLNGNVDYSKNKDENKKSISYGGCYRRIRKIVADDPIIQNILKQIEDIRTNELF